MEEKLLEKLDVMSCQMEVLAHAYSMLQQKVSLLVSMSELEEKIRENINIKL